MSLPRLGYKNLWLPVGLSLDLGEIVLWAAQRRVPHSKELKPHANSHVSELGSKSSRETFMRDTHETPWVETTSSSSISDLQKMCWIVNAVLHLFLKKEWTADTHNMDDLKSIVLSEKSKAQKNTHCMTSLVWSSRRSKTNIWWQKSQQWLPLLGGGDWL